MNGEKIKLLEGLTLSDYFAAAERSLPPLTWLQSRIGSHVMSFDDLRGVKLSESLAAWRYQCADAMLAERAKK